MIPPAAKNGCFYVLDRVTGELISAEPFVKVSWALGIGKHGRPVVNPGVKVQESTSACGPEWRSVVRATG